MNLVDMLSRQDKRLQASGFRVEKALWKEGGGLWRSLVASSGQRASLTIFNVGEVRRLMSRPVTIGWYVRIRPSKTLNQNTARYAVKLRTDGEVVGELNGEIGVSPIPVIIPWPLDGRQISRQTQLQLELDGLETAEAEILVHRVLSRSDVLALARGRGIEIGPGPRPQVLCSLETDVKYVEEMPPQRWHELYNAGGKYSAGSMEFSNYIIGTADQIPAEESSLDFIFGSHVFEHLANPLGHLLRWQRLLRPGGVVIAVIPEMHSTKDLLASPSTPDEFKSEEALGIWQPTLEHYQRFSESRSNSVTAEDLMDRKVSIHVHFYERENIAWLLQRAVSVGEFAGYSIQHSENHKDFYFCIWK